MMNDLQKKQIYDCKNPIKKADEINMFEAKHQAVMRNVIEKLLIWYWSAARDLPWRKTKNPYHIWISEIMLQQTRVEAVKEYYRRFLDALPDIQSLALASEEVVLKLWEGLGYYSRARNLRKAAQKIVEEFNGEFPQNFKDIRSLAGIGDYTAGAISSIAFGLPEPAVDGNVLRVLSRVLNDESDIADSKTKERMTQLLKSVYPSEHCGDVTQSLMELGAIVCVPNGQPKCADCPLEALCLAHQNGRENEVPVKSGKTARKVEKRTVFLLQYENQYAIRKRTEKGLLCGMWELPNRLGEVGEEEAKTVFSDVSAIKQAGTHRHIFTHIEWDMKCYHMIVKQKSEQFLWVNVDEIRKNYAIPAAFQPFLKGLAE